MDPKGARITVLLLTGIFVVTSLNFIVLFYHMTMGYHHTTHKKQSSREVELVRLPMTGTFPDKIVHLAIVSDGFSSNQNLATLIKSILFNRGQSKNSNQVKNFRLHLHLFTLWSDEIFEEMMRSWKLPGVNWTVHNLRQEVKGIEWMPNGHYSGIFGASKILVPGVLATKGVYQAIMLDTDLILQTDVQELWNMAKTIRHNSSAVVFGMTDNQSQWYLRGDNWPAIGKGFNSGVVIMLLDRLNVSQWRSIWTSTVREELELRSSLYAADQDIFNAVFKRNPNLVNRIPCNFNCQMPSENQEEFQYCQQCFHQPKVLHFNHANKNFFSISEETIPVNGLYRDLLSFYTTIDGYQFRNPPTFGRNLGDSNNNQQGSTMSRKYQKSRVPDVLATGTMSRIPKRCSLWIQNGDFKIHPLLMPFSDWSTKANDVILDPSTNKQKTENEVVLVTHFSFDRLGAFERLVGNWEGLISVALYISEPKLVDLFQSWETSTVLSGRDNIALHIVFEIPGRPYPINLLRNIAMQHSPKRADYMFIIDVDFVVPPTLQTSIQNHIAYIHSSITPLALVIPAFEYISSSSSEMTIPVNKSELLKQLELNFVQPFLKTKWPEGQRSTDYIRWVNAQQSYEAIYRENYEPFFVVKRSQVADNIDKGGKFDERFSGYGWNRSVWIYKLWKKLSFQFMVLPDSFVIHVPHSDSVWKKDFTRRLPSSSPISGTFSRQCMERMKKMALHEIDSNTENS